MEKPSTARIALKWGLISAIAIIVYSTILNFTGLWKTQGLSMISFIFLVVGIVMSMREFKSLNNNFINFGEGLGIGTLMSAVAGVIGSIYTYIYMNFIDTTMPQQMMEMQRTQMEGRGLTEEQIDQATQMASKFSSPTMIFVFGILLYLFFGFILSLIVAAIIRKSKPEMDF